MTPTSLSIYQVATAVCAWHSKFNDSNALAIGAVFGFGFGCTQVRNREVNFHIWLSLSPNLDFLTGRGHGGVNPDAVNICFSVFSINRRPGQAQHRKGTNPSQRATQGARLSFHLIPLSEYRRHPCPPGVLSLEDWTPSTMLTYKAGN